MSCKKRWIDKPNKGICWHKHGNNPFRVTLTVNRKQKTVGYAYSFDEAKRMYFEAYIDAFGERPLGPYDEALMDNDGRYYSNVTKKS